MATNFAALLGGGSLPAQAISQATPLMSPMNASDYVPGLPLEEVKPEKTIEKLKPKSELHSEVIKKLESMHKYSSQTMSNFTNKWQWMENKIQAYIALPDYENLMNEMKNNVGLPPEPVKIIVPYVYATLHAAATFLFSVLVGRRPVFPMLAVRGTTAEKARYMEQAIQSNFESSKGYEVLWQMIWDSLIYTFGVSRIGWAEINGKMIQLAGGQRNVTTGLKYAGNKLNAVDPYNYFPDPRVPLHRCPEDGDFVIWLTNQSKIRLKDMEKDGLLKWVDEACQGSGQRDAGQLPAVVDSNRRAKLGMKGDWNPSPADVVSFFTIKEGTVRLVPKDWKLGDSDRSELWKFMWTKDQIIQAEPLGFVHELHPVTVTEPTSLGHEFGSISFADMIGTFQDLISWLVNSRMENVRATINNQFIADPARVEMQDFRSPAPGKVIRLKQAAMGLPIAEAIQQLQVNDITMGHFNDIQTLRTMADSITGINDNMRGIQTAAGRRSATEARMAMQAGASRLSQMAVRISSQAMTGMAEQMISNIQQLMPEKMWAEMSGDDGQQNSTLLTPDMLVGSFNYKISDGSLPYDKTALVEIWKEIMLGVAQDPELRARYDIGKIFDYVAVLGGANNISSFEKTQQPQLAGPGGPPAGAMPVGAAMPPPPTPNPFG